MSKLYDRAEIYDLPESEERSEWKMRGFYIIPAGRIRVRAERKSPGQAGGDDMAAYEMTAKERRIWWRELEMTELTFREQELRNRNMSYSPEYRKDLEKRVAELKERYGAEEPPCPAAKGIRPVLSNTLYQKDSGVPPEEGTAGSRSLRTARRFRR